MPSRQEGEYLAMARPPLLLCGDSMEELEALPDNFVDAVCTDPPYGLSFMGRAWDYQVPGKALWQEVLRVMKPGAHLLAFFGSRTYHRGVVEIEDAGFEIRDCVMWVYGSGFPKSLDVSKAIDKEAGAEREVIGAGPYASRRVNPNGGRTTGAFAHEGDSITAPATPAAQQWSGWGTALKPAHEPIVLARKPFPGTVAGNVLTHGTGGLNIDGCRIHDGSETGNPKPEYKPNYGNQVFGHGKGGGAWENTNGRWPANLIHDGSPEVLALFPDAKGQLAPACNSLDTRKNQNTYGAMARGSQAGPPRRESDKSAARFFYCSKASKADRGEGNPHPTVKPQALMRYLCRLITPPGGLVLDPFMGSGSTGVAAVLEGFRFAGIDLDPDYVALSRRRINQAIQQAMEAVGCS